MDRKFHPLLLSTVDAGEPYAWKGKKAKTPKAPDYMRLAQQQAEQQSKLNRETTQANRVNQFTPYGSLTYAQDPNNPDKWTSTVTLDPKVQQTLDQYLGGQSQGYDALQGYLKNIGDSSLIPKSPVNPGQTGQDALMARLNPSLTQQEESLRTRLYNQGVRPGSEAWDNEFRNFNQSRNDALSQASLYGIGLDNQARATALQEQSLPLNAIISYLRGTQVQDPQFTNYSQQANAAAPDLLGAGQASYGANLNAANAQNASNSNFMSGLMGLAGTAATFFSDRRLKKNIKHIGEYPNGIPKYSFEYIWGEKSIGAMADEVEKVMPEAVGEINGYKTVNYGLLGV